MTVTEPPAGTQDPGREATGTQDVPATASGTVSRTATGTATGTVPGTPPVTPSGTPPVTPSGTATGTGRPGRRPHHVKIFVKSQSPPAAGSATTAGRLAAWTSNRGYLAALTVVVAVVAALGQKVYAETKAGFVKLIVVNGWDLTPWLAPAVFDLAVAAMLNEGIRNARKRHSPWLWWAGAGVVACLSVYTNLQHTGARITGTASAGLCVMWFLRLYYQYRTLVRQREVEDSVAEKLTSTDVLFTVDRKWAEAAWRIKLTKPLSEAVAFRRGLGELTLTERDLAIMAASLQRQIYTDDLFVRMNPHLVEDDPNGRHAAHDDKLEDGKKRKGQKKRKVRLWEVTRRRRAHWLAQMTASDAVDRYLGLPVPERRGVVLFNVSYAPPDTTPLLGSAAIPALPAASAAAPAASALPGQDPQRAIADRPANGGGIPLPPDTFEYELTSPAPPGNGSSSRAANQVIPIGEIRGLPEIDPAIQCECSKTNPDKSCRVVLGLDGTLVGHIERRGPQVRSIIKAVPDWDTRERRISKTDVKTICGMGSDRQTEIAGLFDHIRKIATDQRAAADAAATAAAAVTERPAIES